MRRVCETRVTIVNRDKDDLLPSLTSSQPFAARTLNSDFRLRVLESEYD